jgi:hypothetical protein
MEHEVKVMLTAGRPSQVRRDGATGPLRNLVAPIILIAATRAGTVPRGRT